MASTTTPRCRSHSRSDASFRSYPPGCWAAARRWAARLNRQEVNRSLYRRRRTTIEPHFGLDKKPFEDHVVWFYGLANNRTHQALLTFVIQVLMIDNFEHGRPPEEIQWLLDAAA